MWSNKKQWWAISVEWYMSDHITKISLWHQHLYSKSNKSEWGTWNMIRIRNQRISVATSKRFLPPEYKHSIFFSLTQLWHNFMHKTEVRWSDTAKNKIRWAERKWHSTSHKNHHLKKESYHSAGRKYRSHWEYHQCTILIRDQGIREFLCRNNRDGVPAASMFPPNHQKIEMIT